MVLISIGVGTASALITITLAGNVVVTDNLTVGNDLTVNGTITGALNIYTVDGSDRVLNPGNSDFVEVFCSDLNDIALDGSVDITSGDSSSLRLSDSTITQTIIDMMVSQPAHYFASVKNEGSGSVTFHLEVICLEVPGTQ